MKKARINFVIAGCFFVFLSFIFNWQHMLPHWIALGVAFAVALVLVFGPKTKQQF
jgi:uncharacterized protein (DUF983 family)